LAVSAHLDIKRDATTSSSPFHDCLGAGKSWADCRLAVQTSFIVSRSEAEGNLEERTIAATILGTMADLGQTLGQAETCYSVNKLGGTGWLTNTAVNSLAQTGCTAAVNQALTAVASNAPALGKYTKTGLQGYYMGSLGPIVTPSVQFFLSTLFQGDYADLPVDLHQLGNDLCTKGVAHLTSDPGCTAPRRAGGRVEHTSVNGGEFSYAANGAAATFDNTGTCINCIFSMVLEAANMVDKDGSTPTPIDS
jgi:hypothetical protein